MAWVNYCSRGQVSKPPGGIIENYHELEVSIEWQSKTKPFARCILHAVYRCGVLADFGWSIWEVSILSNLAVPLA